MKDYQTSLFRYPACQTAFVNTWQYIASRLKGFQGYSQIWGYDLLNEPAYDPRSKFQPPLSSNSAVPWTQLDNQIPSTSIQDWHPTDSLVLQTTVLDWYHLDSLVAQKLAAIDPNKNIVVQTWAGYPLNAAGLAHANYNTLQPVVDASNNPMSNVIYSIHMYLPFNYTYQYDATADSLPLKYLQSPSNLVNPAVVPLLKATNGAFPYSCSDLACGDCQNNQDTQFSTCSSAPPPSECYPVPQPGSACPSGIDMALLQNLLLPIREFQMDYGAHIYIGEFSAATWAPNSTQYVSDLIQIFEYYGWDWTYFGNGPFIFTPDPICQSLTSTNSSPFAGSAQCSKQSTRGLYDPLLNRQQLLQRWMGNNP